MFKVVFLAIKKCLVYNIAEKNLEVLIMLKKFLIVALIVTSSFVIAATSEAAQNNSDSENGNCNGGYCKYDRGRSCR